MFDVFYFQKFNLFFHSRRSILIRAEANPPGVPSIPSTSRAGDAARHPARVKGGSDLAGVPAEGTAGEVAETQQGHWTFFLELELFPSASDFSSNNTEEASFPFMNRQASNVPAVCASKSTSTSFSV